MTAIRHSPVSATYAVILSRQPPGFRFSLIGGYAVATRKGGSIAFALRSVVTDYLFAKVLVPSDLHRTGTAIAFTTFP